MKRRLQAFIYFLSEGNLKVFGTICITGLFVTLARVLAPVQIREDQGIQLQAAYRLVQGFGLTVVSSLNFDLTRPPNSEYLTHFPPAFSLLVASLLFLKIPLVTVLKIIYGLTTAVGWFCWAAIGSRLLSASLKLGKFLFPAQYAIAVTLPILFTPSWSEQGTDIFLWSGVPFIVLLLLHSSSSNFRNLLLISAGLLFGLLFSFRYNSVFLVVTAFLILVQVNFPKLIELAKNYAIFLTSSCFFVAPVFIYNKLVISNNILPTQVTQSRGLSLFEGINEIFRTLSMTSILSGFISTSLIKIIQSYALINYIYGFACLLILVLLPFIVAVCKKLSVSAIRKDTAIAISFLPISLLLFFIAAVFPVSYSPINIPRYYLPINFCIILIIYNLAISLTGQTSPQVAEYPKHIPEHKLNSFLYGFNYSVKAVTYIFICLFIIFNLLYRPATFASRKFSTFIDLFLGINGVPKLEYPADKIVTKYNNSSLVMKALAEEDTHTLFLVQDAAILTYNNPEKYRRIPDPQFWEKAFLSKATRLVWVITEPDCPQICASKDILVKKLVSQPNPISIDLALPDLKLLFVDPANGTRIMVSDLPDEYKFSNQH